MSTPNPALGLSLTAPNSTYTNQCVCVSGVTKIKEDGEGDVQLSKAHNVRRGEGHPSSVPAPANFLLVGFPLLSLVTQLGRRIPSPLVHLTLFVEVAPVHPQDRRSCLVPGSSPAFHRFPVLIGHALLFSINKHTPFGYVPKQGEFSPRGGFCSQFLK